MNSHVFNQISILMLVSLVCGLPMAADLSADTIILKGGQSLTGNILIEKENLLYLDIGLTLLKIPREEILEYEYANMSENNLFDANNSSETKHHTQETNKLYLVTDQKKTTIEKCVEAVSEAVVKVSTPAGMGSGFFFHKDGYLITNYHVIEKETKIKVTVFQKVRNGFEKKTFKKVKIEAINPFLDLALLKVEDLGDTMIKPVTFGRMDKIKIGEKVFAIGNPLGLERTVTDGVISTKNRAFEGLVYIQTNADINPGNSGGPLFNLAGQVIGVTNMGYIFYGGLGFAIPVDYVTHFIENREVFAYDKDNPNTGYGYKYLQPAPRRNRTKPEFLRKSGNSFMRQ
jgi:serine protease Do